MKVKSLLMITVICLISLLPVEAKESKTEPIKEIISKHEYMHDLKSVVHNECIACGSKEFQSRTEVDMVKIDQYFCPIHSYFDVATCKGVRCEVRKYRRNIYYVIYCDRCGDVYSRSLLTTNIVESHLQTEYN